MKRGERQAWQEKKNQRGKKSKEEKIRFLARHFLFDSRNPREIQVAGGRLLARHFGFSLSLSLSLVGHLCLASRSNAEPRKKSTRSIRGDG